MHVLHILRIFYILHISNIYHFKHILHIQEYDEWTCEPHPSCHRCVEQILNVEGLAAKKLEERMRRCMAQREGPDGQW